MQLVGDSSVSLLKAIRRLRVVRIVLSLFIFLSKITKFDLVKTQRNRYWPNIIDEYYLVTNYSNSEKTNRQTENSQPKIISSIFPFHSTSIVIHTALFANIAQHPKQETKNIYIKYL